MNNWLHRSRNLDIILDNGLSCAPNITVAWSCSFTLYNVCTNINIITKDAKQLLVQALVIYRLDYCNSLLSGLPVSVKPLQCIQNAAALLVFNLPKFSHMTPFLHDLHWLPVADVILFKMEGLVFKAINGTAPMYLQTLVRPHTPGMSTSLNYISWPAGTLITESKQRSLSEMTTLLCSGASVLEPTPNQCQDSHLLQKTRDSFVQTST